VDLYGLEKGQARSLLNTAINDFHKRQGTSTASVSFQGIGKWVRTVCRADASSRCKNINNNGKNTEEYARKQML
jgi:hypothetical protein